MAEKKSIFIDLSIETGAALKNLEALNRVQLDLKDSTTRLKKERKDLKKAIDIADNSEKKNAKTIAELNKELDKNNAALTKNRVNLKKVSSEIRESTNDLGKLTKNATRFRDKMSGAMITALKGFGAQILIAFGVREILRFGKELNDLAVEMEALNRKAEIVFGDSLPAVTKAAEANALAIGLTTREYIKAAGSIQDILVPLGFQRDRAAELSTEMVDLAGALSVWSGGQVTAEDATERLQKALVGETESLKTLGIVVDQSSKGFNERIAILQKDQNLTKQQAKALDIQRQILGQTTDAQDNYNDSQDTLAVKQARANAQLRETKEILAEQLAPELNNITNWWNRVLGGLSSVIRETKQTQDATALLKDAMNDLGIKNNNILSLAGGTEGSEFIDMFNTMRNVVLNYNDSADDSIRLLAQQESVQRDVTASLEIGVKNLDNQERAQLVYNKALLDFFTLEIANREKIELARQKAAANELFRLQKEEEERLAMSSTLGGLKKQIQDLRKEQDLTRDNAGFLKIQKEINKIQLLIDNIKNLGDAIRTVRELESIAPIDIINTTSVAPAAASATNGPLAAQGTDGQVTGGSFIILENFRVAIEQLQELRDQDVISEAEYRNKLFDLSIQAGAQKLAEQERIQGNFDNLQFMRENDLINEQEYQDELARIKEQAIAQDVEIKEKKEEIDEQGNINLRANLALSANIAGQAASLAEKGSDAHKALATTQALINTYLAASAAFASAGNPIAGAILASIAVAGGLAMVAKIRSFDEGGPVKLGESGYTGPGAKHESKGLIEVHGDEYVLNKADVKKLGGWRAIEAMLDGHETNTTGAYVTGGTVRQTIDTTSSDTARQFSQLQSEFKNQQIVAIIEDINEGQTRVNIVEDRASA